MNKIDTSTWKEFKVGDLFDIRPTKSYGKTNQYLFDENGKIPVVVNSAQNNGIGGYTSHEATENGGIVTFSDTTDANSIFYQKEPFVGYSHVQGMHPKSDRWSETSLLFFASVFKTRALNMGFSYSNKFRRDIAMELTIKLPTTSTGEPDLVYMESYIKQVMEKEEVFASQLESLSEEAAADGHEVDVSEWREFRVGDLFEQERGKEASPARLCEGDMPLIAEINDNNGLLKYADGTYLFDGNALTVSVNYAENVFYQPESFCASVNILILRNDKMTCLSGLFIASILHNLHRGKFDYVNKISKDRLNHEMISLPVTPVGIPDWAYMERFMRQQMDKGQQLAEHLDMIWNAESVSV